jgi:hypothetical protein
MPKQHGQTETASEISLNPQPIGMRAVYLVETRSAQEARELTDLFDELSSHIQIKQLCKGSLISYAVQAHESDSALLDELEDFIKARYAFVVTHRSFDEVIYRIVKELCQDTGSKMLPMSYCNICGKTEPFPTTVISISNEDGSVLTSRSYCGSCTAQAVAPSNKEFIRSLLSADKRNFAKLESAELVRRPSRKQPIRFKIKTGSLQA